MSVGTQAGLDWRHAIAARVADGARFAGLYGTSVAEGCRITAVLAVDGGFDLLPLVVRADEGLRYPALTVAVPSAFWWERAAADLSGVVPEGHPRLDPLLLPVIEGSARPRPGHTGEAADAVRHTTPPGPIDVVGRGLFTIAYGPVRSGPTETIEYLVETPGEDIPRVNIRPHFKHRGVAKAFEGRSVADGVLVAERVEGIASVAHATAYAHAIERLAGVVPPPRAALLRVVFGELERVANHLDVAIKLADAAALAVAVSRFGLHKEHVMRLMGEITASRFGRGMLVPGGVAAGPMLAPAVIADRVRTLRRRLRPDVRLLMRTPSFLDRLRSTGPLTVGHAREWGAVGPIGRASGVDDDNRWTRPTDAYPSLTSGLRPAGSAVGDTLARLTVRWDEVETSFTMIERACVALDETGHAELATPLPEPTAIDGIAVGWAEGPQGEIVYVVEVRQGTITRCLARTPSLHDLVLFHDVFRGDVLTDFAFIEAGFGLSAAGVAM